MLVDIRYHSGKIQLWLVTKLYRNTGLLYGTGWVEGHVLRCLDAGMHNVDIWVHLEWGL